MQRCLEHLIRWILIQVDSMVVNFRHNVRESQRELLKLKRGFRGRALKAYQNHQKEMDLLKKYYKSYNRRNAKTTT